MKISTFTATDGKEVALYTWDNVPEPRLVLQIVHGMCEHSARYDHFAKFCNANGVVVVMNDLRGHGKTATPETYGYEEGDMWNNNVNDQILLSAHLVEKYKLPLVILGHSYGSFIGQRLVELDKHACAYILSGTEYMKSLLYFVGGIIARGESKKKGGELPCQIMADMSFKSYEKKFPGKNSWLSVNSENVAKYNEDEACGYVASNNFYATFMTGIADLYTKQAKAEIDLEKPIYIFAGSKDPVGNYGKGIVKLFNWYKKVGVNSVSFKLYEGYRHEMLNETINDKVYDDVLKYLKKFM